MVVSLAVIAFRAMLPVYMPNSAAILTGGGRPIDDDRAWDGWRASGGGKTRRGTAARTLAGTFLAVILNAAAPTASGALGVSFPAFPLIAGFGLALGVMLDDIGASLVRRHSGREHGAAFPGLDQLNFVVGTFAPAFVVALGWFAVTFPLSVLATVPVMTPVLRVATNVGMYSLGLKNEPW